MADFCGDSNVGILSSVAMFVLFAIGVAVGWCNDVREEYYDATEEGL